MSDISRIAEEFAEHKFATSQNSSTVAEIMRSVWQSVALEVLTFAVPRMNIPDDVPDSQAGCAD